jgi:hypothetical protein
MNTFSVFGIPVAGVLAVLDCEDQLHDLENFLDAKYDCLFRLRCSMLEDSLLLLSTKMNIPTRSISIYKVHTLFKISV